MGSDLVFLLVMRVLPMTAFCGLLFCKSGSRLEKLICRVLMLMCVVVLVSSFL